MAGRQGCSRLVEVWGAAALHQKSGSGTTNSSLTPNKLPLLVVPNNLCAGPGAVGVSSKNSKYSVPSPSRTHRLVHAKGA